MIAQDLNLSTNDSAVNGTDDREAHPKFWIAAYTRPRSEKKVAKDLAKDGIETYVPIQKVEKQWSDRKKMIDVIVIPMVVFMKLKSKDDLLTVKRDSNVVKALTYPGSREPANIPEDQIENLRLMLTKAESTIEFVGSPVQVGDNVRVKAGNLKGLIGRVERIGEIKSRLLIRIDLLGGVRVDINSEDLEVL